MQHADSYALGRGRAKYDTVRIGLACKLMSDIPGSLRRCACLIIFPVDALCRGNCYAVIRKVSSANPHSA